MDVDTPPPPPHHHHHHHRRSSNDSHHHLATTPTEISENKISAYYCLVFPNFTYYLQTLTVSIGRRPAASSSDSRDLVDIDLGPLSQVSRLHARIEYDEDQERFVLSILGRNGAWVDGVWYASGRRVPLGARTQIMIATQTFHFILPSIPESDDSQSISSHSSMDVRSPSVDILSMSPTSPARSPSPELSPVDVDVDDSRDGSFKPKTSKKRKKVIPAPRLDIKPPLVKAIPPEDLPVKPAITYANLAYRAIKARGGRATLQDVCKWIASNFEWFQCNEDGNWQSSVRHTLSSNKGFVKVSRKTANKGKGYWWTVNKAHEAAFESQMPSSVQGETGSSLSKKRGKKEKGKLTANGSELPLSSHQVQAPISNVPLPTPATTPVPSTPASTRPSVSPSSAPADALRLASTTDPPPASTPLLKTQSDIKPSLTGDPSSVILPIVVKELAPDHPAVLATVASTGQAARFLPVPPIVHDRGTNTLVLSPQVFGSLEAAELTRLAGLGFQKALEELKPQIVQFVKKKLTAEAGSSLQKVKKGVKAKSKAKAKDIPAAESSSRPKDGVLSDPSVPDEPPSKRRKTEIDETARCYNDRCNVIS